MKGRGIERRDDIERRQRKEMERHVVVSKGKRQERNGRNQDKERNKKKWSLGILKNRSAGEAREGSGTERDSSVNARKGNMTRGNGEEEEGSTRRGGRARGSVRSHVVGARTMD